MWRHILPILEQKYLRKNRQTRLSSVQLYRRSLQFPIITMVHDFAHKNSVFCKRKKSIAFLDSLHFCSLSLPALAVGFLFRAFFLHGAGCVGAKLFWLHRSSHSELWKLNDCLGSRSLDQPLSQAVHQPGRDWSSNLCLRKTVNDYVVWTSWISPKGRDRSQNPAAGLLNQISGAGGLGMCI